MNPRTLTPGPIDFITQTKGDYAAECSLPWQDAEASASCSALTKCACKRNFQASNLAIVRAQTSKPQYQHTVDE